MLLGICAALIAFDLCKEFICASFFGKEWFNSKVFVKFFVYMLQDTLHVLCALSLQNIVIT